MFDFRVIFWNAYLNGYKKLKFRKQFGNVDVAIISANLFQHKNEGFIWKYQSSLFKNNLNFLQFLNTFSIIVENFSYFCIDATKAIPDSKLLHWNTKIILLQKRRFPIPNSYIELPNFIDTQIAILDSKLFTLNCQIMLLHK